MPDAASLLGVMPEFEFGGRTYKVHPRTLELEGRFAKWCSDQSLLQLRAHADVLGPDLLQMQLDGWRHDLSSRLYEWGSFIVQRVLQTDSGAKHLAYLQLGKADPSVPRSLVDRVAKDPAKWQELLLKMREASGELDPPRGGPPPDEPAGHSGNSSPEGEDSTTSPAPPF
jgi:hypothetical protein